MTKKQEPIEAKVIKEEKTDIVKQETSTSLDPETLISQAINKNLPVETMERLLVMRKELKDEWAKEQFDKAMAGFQGECPIINKNAKAGSGNFTYKYADLAHIVGQVKDILSKNGLSYSFNSKKTEKSLITYCQVKHINGYTETSKFEIMIDVGARMNISQKDGAASTYGKRYAFCNAFGILTGDEDNDGQNTNSQPQSRVQKYNGAPPVAGNDLPKNPPQQAIKKIYCARCYKAGKKIVLSQAVADYSKKNYGYILCRECQDAAKKHKEKTEVDGEKGQVSREVEGNKTDQSNFNKAGTINQGQIEMIRKSAKGRLDNSEDITVCAFLEMHGISVTDLSLLSYKQGILANKLILAHINNPVSN